ncbi:MAG: threonine aldolase family protein, partial [Acidimicrobiaceae bacterium]
LIDVPTVDGKLRPSDIRDVAHLRGSIHHAEPAVVSITQATEMGTIYTAEEVRAICETAHELDMLVHMDGARIVNAAVALGSSAEALRSFTIDAGVDVLSFGGVKAGLMFGEAVVFFNTGLASRVEYIRKQVGQLNSKMRF